MKRKLVWLLTLLMVMQFGAMTVSADTVQTDTSVSGIHDEETDNEEHIHSYKWVVTQKASATKNGTKTCICSECGKIAKTATIKATGKYKIKYRLNGGKNSSKNPVAYNKSTKTIKLKNPTRTGYTFKGWYKNEKMTKKVTSIKKGSTGKVTLYAKWSKKQYKISYTLNGGKNNKKNPKSYTIATKTFKLKNPTRTGYTFKGWYSDKELTKKVTSIKKGSTGKVTLYAKWEKKTYTITYVLNGGVQNDANPTSYTVTSAVTLKTPTKTDRTFDGWYSDKKLTKKVTSIKKGSTGNITLYAKWEKVQTSYKNRDAASKERFEECAKILRNGIDGANMQKTNTFIDYFNSIAISRSTTDGSWMYMYISSWDYMSDGSENYTDRCYAELPTLTKKCLMAIAPVGGEELYNKVNKLIKKYGAPYKVPSQGTIKESIPGLKVTITPGTSGIEIEFWAE